METKPRDAKAQLKPNPIIQKLGAAAQDEPVVLLDGYIGESDKNAVRLYNCLALDNYLEIPKDCVVETMPLEDDKEGRTRLFVKGSCKVTAVSVSRYSTTADSLQEPPRVLMMRPRPKHVREMDELRAFVERISTYADYLRDAYVHNPFPGPWEDWLPPGILRKTDAVLMPERE